MVCIKNKNQPNKDVRLLDRFACEVASSVDVNGMQSNVCLNLETRLL